MLLNLLSYLAISLYLDHASALPKLETRMTPGWCTFRAAVAQNCRFQGNKLPGLKEFQLQIQYIKDNKTSQITGISPTGRWLNTKDPFANVTVSVPPQTSSTPAASGGTTPGSASTSVPPKSKREDKSPTMAPSSAPTPTTLSKVASSSSATPTPTPTPAPPRYIQIYSIISDNHELHQNLTLAYDSVLDVVMFDYGGDQWNDTQAMSSEMLNKGCKKEDWQIGDNEKPDCVDFWRSVYRWMDCRFYCA